MVNSKVSESTPLNQRYAIDVELVSYSLIKNGFVPLTWPIFAFLIKSRPRKRRPRFWKTRAVNKCTISFSDFSNSWENV